MTAYHLIHSQSKWFVGSFTDDEQARILEEGGEIHGPYFSKTRLRIVAPMIAKAAEGRPVHLLTKSAWRRRAEVHPPNLPAAIPPEKADPAAIEMPVDLVLTIKRELQERGFLAQGRGWVKIYGEKVAPTRLVLALVESDKERSLLRFRAKNGDTIVTQSEGKGLWISDIKPLGVLDDLVAALHRHVNVYQILVDGLRMHNQNILNIVSHSGSLPFGSQLLVSPQQFPQSVPTALEVSAQGDTVLGN